MYQADGLALLQYISMLHSSNPNLVIAEIGADEQGEDAIIQRLYIPHVLMTSKYSLYCPTKAGLQTVRKFSSVAPESRNSVPGLIEVTDLHNVKADILLVANPQDINSSLLNLKNMIICTLEISGENKVSIMRELPKQYGVQDKDMSLTIAFPSNQSGKKTPAGALQSTQLSKSYPYQ